MTTVVCVCVCVQGFQQVQQPPTQHIPEDKWSRFAGNQTQYYDNRFNKRTERSPDFKHKITGEALWISGRDTPAWVPEWVEQHLAPQKMH
jgi:hypothetical protein